jgi:cysteine-rich repeat protein
VGAPRISIGSLTLAVGLTAAAAAMSSCTTLSGFACTADAQCERAEGRGVCEAVGFCAYPDSSCVSGLRFSPDAANPFADECTEVDPPIATTTTDASGDASSSSGDATSDSSSEGPPVPVCGNGVTEDMEACDDANAMVGDGCNPDCRVSGVLVTSFVSELPGIDFGRSLQPVEGGDVIVVGEGDEQEGDRDILLGRFGPEGEHRWIRYEGGTAGGIDRASALALTDTDTVVVAGEIRPDESPSAARADIWLAELGIGDGEPVWQETDGAASPSHDVAVAMVRLAGGDLVVGGRTGTTGTADMLARRYAVVDGAVERVWTRTFDGAAGTADGTNAILQDARGRIFVGGYRHATTVDVDRYLRVLSPLDGVDARPPCLDDGSTADGRVPEGDDRILSLALAPSGHVAAAGYATKTVADARDAWVGWYDPSGCTLQWTRTVPGSAHADDAAQAVVVDANEQIVTVGYLRESNSADLWVAKWDDAGDPLWEADLINGPGDETDVAYGVALDDSGDILVTGRLSTPGAADLWVGRFTP